MDFRNEREVEHKLLRPLFSETLGYPDDELEWARPVHMHLGRERRTKEADLVAKYRGRPVVTVEAKSPNEPVQAHLGQVDSYAFHLQTPYSVITNGRHFLLRGYYSFNSRINVIDSSVEELASEHWRNLQNLISFRNIASSIAEEANPVTEPDVRKITDYRRFFRRIHGTIRDMDKLDPAAAFDELSKVLFLKAAEEEWSKNTTLKPVLSSEKILEWNTLGGDLASRFVNEWFSTATTELYPGVFDDHPQIHLSPTTLAAVLAQMHGFKVRNGDVDVKGRALEEFLPSQLRGKGLGQFFTPRPVVEFMSELAGISIHDVVADFACGSGGFLIKAFERMEHGVEQLPAGTLQRLGFTRADLLEEVKSHQIFGIDAEPQAARTAKMNMLMWGDGRKVVRGNALDTKDHSGTPYELTNYDSKDQGSGCTLVLANPPFGSQEKDATILKSYKLGARDQHKKSEKTEVLFIERGLRLLRPEGRMLIVLPQGLMSGVSNDRVRDFIHQQAEVRAVISLPTHTFVQSGVPTVNTCVLFLQKFTQQKKDLIDRKTRGLDSKEIRRLIRSDPELDYSMFMGTAEFVGYEPGGRSIIKNGEKTDLDLLLEDFIGGETGPNPDVDLFEFASRHYGERSTRRREQIVRGTTKGLKTSFTLNLSETDERLDPPYYLFNREAREALDRLAPLGGSVVERKARLSPQSEEELDAEYRYASVSSDGEITLTDFVRGDEISPTYRPKVVRANDFVYNPMRINIGSIGIVPSDVELAVTSPDYVVFSSDTRDPEFLLSLLRSPFYRMYMDVISTGSIRDRLYFSDLQSMRVPEFHPRKQAIVAGSLRRINDERRKVTRELKVARDEVLEQLSDLTRERWGYARPSSLESAFRSAVRRWYAEAGYLSSAPARTEHPAYKEVINMGPAVVPLILQELRQHPDLWFEALEQLTGSSPASPRPNASVAELAAQWVIWGKEEDLLSDA